MTTIRYMLIGKLIDEAALYPRWYGLAWRDPGSFRAVTFPVPLHLVARGLRRAWWALARGSFKSGWVRDWMPPGAPKQRLWIEDDEHMRSMDEMEKRLDGLRIRCGAYESAFRAMRGGPND